MNMLKIYSREYLNTLYSSGDGEVKFGEKVQTVNTIDDLKATKAQFVLFGIPEDVGVMANFGRKGTIRAWESCLKALLNAQANSFTNAENLVVLGEIECSTEMKTANLLDPEGDNFGDTIGKLVEKIDIYVSQIVRSIVAAGKIPIAIGGGQNNALGIIKGTSEAMGGAINVINFDAHTDFKPLNYRHNGNGFSYAMEKGYLNKYAVFGIHKSYTSQEVYNRMEQFKNRIGFYFFEDIILKENPPFYQASKIAKQFVSSRKCGLEIDVDAIEGFSSTAMTPSGFSLTQARQFVRYFSRNPKPAYVHICEAVPEKSKNDTVGKVLAYLVLDVVSL